ncbi:MAG TPA: hypothetical protein VEG39_10280 [Clostridia bacterium]|nr:hypothetical protein [Clostridia bacterium]
MKASIDVRKIFLTPPNTMFERITLILMMVGTFTVFFRPLTFTQMGLDRISEISIQEKGIYETIEKTIGLLHKIQSCGKSSAGSFVFL